MSSKRRNSLLLAALFLILGGVVLKNYLFKAPTPIERQKTVYAEVSAKFNNDVASNAAKWQNDIVEISGTVTGLDAKGLTLDNSIYCQFKFPDSLASQKKGNTLNIKGRFIGYDDLLEESKLDQCITVP